MDNYGNDYFMSQEGYPSIDFTLLDRPNSNISSAPESTAALLPDLHVADSSFSSFDFLDGPGVDAFGGVLREADEAHSRDQGGYRADVQKYKKDRSLLQNSVALHRGDGDPDSELPSADFQIPFEVQKPISNLDFFSQGHTKESGHWDQQANTDSRNDAADGNHDFFAQGQITQQAHTGAGGGGAWYNTWGVGNNEGDQTQVFFQTPTYDEASNERGLMQMKGSTSQLAGHIGYHSQVPINDPVPKATHSFLPPTKQSDSRQAANMGLGLPTPQVNTPASTMVKSSSRSQPFDYEGIMNGSSGNQFWQNSSTAVENAASARRHQNSDTDLGGQDPLCNHAQSSKTHMGPGGPGGWYNTWGGSNSEQTQGFFQTPSNDASYDERRMIQMKGSTPQLAGQMGYHSLSSSQIGNSDPVPKATHSFLPTAKQSDSRQVSNMGLGLPNAQVHSNPSAAIKNNSRAQPFEYEGLMNGSSANQFRQSSSIAVDNTQSVRRHQTNDTDLGGQDAFRSHTQNHAQSPKTHGGAGGWYNSWGVSNNQGDQTQLGFFQTPYGEPSDDRRLLQMKGNSSQLAGQIGYHSLSSSQVPSNEPMPKSMHSFLPTAKQNDSRQVSNMGLGLPTQVNTAASTMVKNSPGGQQFDYEGMVNGSSINLFRQSSSTAVENTAARRHQPSDLDLGDQDTLRSHAQSQNFKYPGQNLWSLAPVESAPLKLNDYDFSGGQYALKGQTQGEIGQQLSVGDLQAWHQHPLLSQSNQQQAAPYQQPYQELPRHQEHHVDQQSQHPRQQQMQQFLAANQQNQSLGNQLSAFLSESSLQDLSRSVQPERQSVQLPVDNPRALLQTNYPAHMNNIANLNWTGADPSTMQGLAHDYLMGADQNFNWQALALKASQVDPLYGALATNRRDASPQQSLGGYTGMQSGLQDYYNGKLAPATSSQVGKPAAKSLGPGGSMFGRGTDYQPEAYDAASNLQSGAQSNNHVNLGKMPFWQNPYPQPVEPNRNVSNLSQASLPPRSPQVSANSHAEHNRSQSSLQPRGPQVPVNSQVRAPMNWRGLPGQQEALQGGLFSQNVANAEALKQSIFAGRNIQQNTQQGAANSRQSAHGFESPQFIQQSSSQATSSTQNVADQLNLRVESYSGINEVMPGWSLGRNAPARKDVEQFNLGAESNRGATDVMSARQLGAQSIPVQKDLEQHLEGESSSGHVDALPAWSRRQNAMSQKDADQLNHTGDSTIGGSTSSGKDLLNTRSDPEKISQEEMSLLDGRRLREANSGASPAPSPDSSLFISTVKQKTSAKTSTLSRNTLELLNKADEPTESSSMHDEDEEEDDELDPEDSGANASSISLAHLRRNQASGPLSPQGFGLRLAPPSHLSQNSQGGSLSRSVGTLANLGGDASQGTSVQAPHAPQSTQVPQSPQPAQTPQAPQPAQAASMSKNVNTAAQLQFLSQLAQRGQNPNGLNPWLSGVVSRAGSNATLFPSRMGDGNGPEIATASAPSAAAVEMSGMVPRFGGNAALFSQRMAEGNGANSATASTPPVAISDEPALSDMDAKSGSSASLLVSRTAEENILEENDADSVVVSAPPAALSGLSGLVGRSGATTTPFTSRIAEGSVSAVTSAPLAALRETSGLVARSGSSGGARTSTVAEGNVPDSAKVSTSDAAPMERLVARSGSTTGAVASAAMEGKVLDSAAVSTSHAAPLERGLSHAAAVERGLSGLAARPGSTTGALTSAMAEGKIPDSATVNASNAAALERGLSGLVARPGSSGNLFMSRMAEAKAPDSVTGSEPSAVAVERSGFSGVVPRLHGSNSTLFTSRASEGKGPESATPSASLAAAVERSGFPGFVARPGSSTSPFGSRITDGRATEYATSGASFGGVVDRSGLPGLVGRSGMNAGMFPSRMMDAKGPDSAAPSGSISAAVERGFSGFVARSASNASLFTSRMADGKVPESAKANVSFASAVDRSGLSGLSGLVGRTGSNTSFFASRLGDGKGLVPTMASAPGMAPPERSGNSEHSGSRFFQNSLFVPPPPKKRKEHPPLIPWREAISQSGGYVSSTSASELEWAVAANRIPDKEPYEEVIGGADTRTVVLSRAKRRLRMTTHLMQQITPPVPAMFMQSRSSEDRESATYLISKLAMAEACRIAAIARRIREVAAARDAEESRIERERELAMKEAEKSGEIITRPVPLPANIADRFKLRMKLLENDLQRLENSPSAVDLVREMQDTERIGLVNRLAVHHSNLHLLQNSDSSHRAAAQKYVTTVPMPNSLPEGLICVSL